MAYSLAYQYLAPCAFDTPNLSAMICRYQRIVGAKVDLPDGTQMRIKGEEIEEGVNQMVRPQKHPSFLQFLTEISAP